jgi:hypothetical protein
MIFLTNLGAVASLKAVLSSDKLRKTTENFTDTSNFMSIWRSVSHYTEMLTHGIRSVKRHLKATLYALTKLTDIQLLTYLQRRALLEEPPIVQPLKNFPTFYGTRRFITVFTRALHCSLS